MAASILTEDSFELLRGVARNAVVTAAETGQLPAGFEDPLSAQEMEDLVDGWLDENKGTLVGMSFDAVAGVLQGVIFPDEPLEKYQGRVSQLSDEELVSLAELRATEAEARKMTFVDDRLALLDGIRTTSFVLLRGALAAGSAAVLGVS